MAGELNEREQALAAMLRATTVALGCALIEKAGEEEAFRVFSKMMDQRIKALKDQGKLGKGFQVLANMVSMTAPYFGQEVSFDVENMVCRIKKCGLWEAGKQMGYAKRPLCIRCKANSDTALNYLLPGYKKTIQKALWRGDDECYMTYHKEEG
jgi:hypothetical protein